MLLVESEHPASAFSNNHNERTNSLQLPTITLISGMGSVKAVLIAKCRSLF